MSRSGARKSFTKASRRNRPPVFTPTSYNYPAFGGEKMRDDMAAIDAVIKQFRKDFNHKLEEDKAHAEIAAGYAVLENIYLRLQPISTDLHLRNSIDRAGAPRRQEIADWVDSVFERVSFFEGQIGDLSPARFRRLKAEPGLEDYRARLNEVWREHHGEHLLEQRPARKSESDYKRRVEPAKDRYHEAVDHIRLRLNGRMVSYEKATALYAEASGPEEKRIGRALTRAMQRHAPAATRAINAVMEHTQVWAKKQHYDRPEEYHDPALPPRIIDTMARVVNDAAPVLAHRYYAAQEAAEEAQEKAGLGPRERTYFWRTARRIGLSAARKFYSPETWRQVRDMFDDRHLDARVRRGPHPQKNPQGFAIDGYALVNFDGSCEETFSGLFHEVPGHKAHHLMLRHRFPNSHILREAPEDAEETHGILMQMIGSAEAIRREKDPECRRWLMAERVEMILRWGPEQLAQYEFERKAQQERANGPLRTRRLCALWVEKERLFKGPKEKVKGADRYGWMHESHTIDHPFYYQRYAFATVAAAVLYGRYLKAAQRGEKSRLRWVRRYEQKLLSAGATKTVEGHFRAMRLDPARSKFHQEGVAVIRALVEEALDAAFEGTGVKKPPPPAMAV